MMNEVKKSINKYKLLSKGDKVVVAVSGGPDSVVLLHVLKSLIKEYDLLLSICHLNHQLRGKAADEDANFVKALGEKWGIDTYIFSEDVAAFSKLHKMSFEEGARELRYKCFEKVMKDTRSNKLAVGQNKNDQTETFFMRLFRGAGLEGLTSIKFKRDHIIRPLLGVDRLSIEAYLLEHGLAFRTDLTNEETLYMRNKIRNEMLPYIKETFNDNIIDQVYTTSLLLQDDLDFIENEVDKYYEGLRFDGSAFQVKLDAFDDIHPSILSRLIRKMIFKLLNSLKGVSYGHVQSVMALLEESKHGNVYRIKEKLCFEISYDTLWVYVIKKQKPLKKTKFEVDKTFHWSSQSLKALREPCLNKEKNVITIDKDCIQGDLFVRTRQAGDRFSPLGMKGSKKLSDYLIDLKIPAFKRDEILLLCDEEEIIWVVGYRMSEKYKVSKNTLSQVSIQHDELNIRSL